MLTGILVHYTKTISTILMTPIGMIKFKVEKIFKKYVNEHTKTFFSNIKSNLTEKIF